MKVTELKDAPQWLPSHAEKAPEPEGFCPGCGMASNGQCPACREMQQESARLNRYFHS